MYLQPVFLLSLLVVTDAFQQPFHYNEHSSSYQFQWPIRKVGIIGAGPGSVLFLFFLLLLININSLSLVVSLRTVNLRSLDLKSVFLNEILYLAETGTIRTKLSRRLCQTWMSLRPIFGRIFLQIIYNYRMRKLGMALNLR